MFCWIKIFRLHPTTNTFILFCPKTCMIINIYTCMIINIYTYEILSIYTCMILVMLMILNICWKHLLGIDLGFVRKRT